ncbi:MAG: SH3 domain-containing protein [Pseudomonadota bacterium]
MIAVGPNKPLVLALIVLVMLNIFMLSLYLAEKSQVKGLRNEIISLREEVERKLSEQNPAIPAAPETPGKNPPLSTAAAAASPAQPPAAGKTPAGSDGAVSEKIKALAKSIKFEDKSPAAPAKTQASGKPKTKEPYFRVEGVTDYLNVRGEPGTEGLRLGRIPAGATCLKNMRESSDLDGETWIKVQSGDLNGWVHSKFLSPVSGCP